GGEIDMHFHVFEASNLVALVRLVAERRRLSWVVQELTSPFPEACPNGILLVLRVRKHGMARLLSHFHGRRSRRHVIRADARRPTEADVSAWHAINRR